MYKEKIRKKYEQNLINLLSKINIIITSFKKKTINKQKSFKLHSSYIMIFFVHLTYGKMLINIIGNLLDE